MPKKIFIPIFLFAATLLLSSCELKDKAKLKILNKIDDKIDSEITETQVSPTTVPTPSDQDLLNQLNQDQDPVLEDQFTQLQGEF